MLARFWWNNEVLLVCRQVSLGREPPRCPSGSAPLPHVVLAGSFHVSSRCLIEAHIVGSDLIKNFLSSQCLVLDCKRKEVRSLFVSTIPNRIFRDIKPVFSEFEFLMSEGRH